MASILVVGGAGYVGSSAAAYLRRAGHEVHILDDLSTGFREAVYAAECDRFIMGRAGDRHLVSQICEQYGYDAAFYFAARTIVSESFEKKDEYYEVNVNELKNFGEIFGAYAKANKRECVIVYSSSCSVYGIPERGVPEKSPLSEDTPFKPNHPYGETKLEAEKVLEKISSKFPLRVVSLRYFNAAGCLDRMVGEMHDPETHLIPTLLRAGLHKETVSIYGDKWATRDGTCERDYIHVEDLARAHIAAFERAGSFPKRFEAFNLGTGRGTTVKEMVEAATKELGMPIATQVREPRAGDPPSLVANPGRAKELLGFTARHGLQTILRSALAWERERLNLRPAVFLDRDGTINDDPGYLSDPKHMKLLPAVGSALFRLQKEGYKLIVISNQSGVGRGLIAREMLPKINAELDRQLAEFKVKLDHYELCVHHPDQNCECRKPKPKLILDAARKLRIDLSRSFMVGDKVSDLGAGRAAGVRGVALVRTGDGKRSEKEISQSDADFVGDKLADVAVWIASQQV